ncbi:MAG: Uncharacterized protein FD148_442 [Methylocystaceae bacterium]|nr:MAG: Uncharacterized protein FD148_442 [Methylocystaceae bacterium]
MTRVQMFHRAVNRRLALAGFAAALMATPVFRPTAAYSVNTSHTEAAQIIRSPSGLAFRRHRSAADAEPGRYRRRYQALLWRCSW